MTHYQNHYHKNPNNNDDDNFCYNENEKKVMKKNSKNGKYFVLAGKRGCFCFLHFVLCVCVCVCVFVLFKNILVFFNFRVLFVFSGFPKFQVPYKNFLLVTGRVFCFTR